MCTGVVYSSRSRGRREGRLCRRATFSATVPGGAGKKGAFYWQVAKTLARPATAAATSGLAVPECLCHLPRQERLANSRAHVGEQGLPQGLGRLPLDFGGIFI